MKPWLLAFSATLAVLLGVTGVGLIIYGLWQVWKHARTRRWPTVQGTILSSTTTVRMPEREAADEQSRSLDEPPQPLYRPEVRYTYTVGGRSFTGERISTTDVEVSSETYARSIAQRYVPGTPVAVRHDPSDPAQAVLEPGIHLASWLLPAAGILFLIVSGGLAFFVRWYWKR